MKGLIKISIIIAALIGVGTLTSILITSNLSNRVAATHEYAFEEGRTQGYEVGFREGSRAGYQDGSKIGYEMSQDKDISDEETGFYFTYNPTYDELQAILAESNKTTAMEINYYAGANGIRTAYVRCQIARKTTERMVHIYHLVAFETVDRGFIIIRPRSHEEVKVEVGKSYSELNGFPTPSYDDTITKITIVW
ncbi:hypothetical protein ES705_34787 [subsurface metagenome]